MFTPSHAFVQAEIGVVDDVFQGQSVDPAGDRPLTAALEKLVPVGGDQLDRVAEVAGRDRVLDRLVDRVGLAIPSRRAAVKLDDEPRSRARQLMAQQLGEQMVVAVPLALGIEGNDERVLAFEPFGADARNPGLSSPPRTKALRVVRGPSFGS